MSAVIESSRIVRTRSRASTRRVRATIPSAATRRSQPRASSSEST